jgi:hypothetical protein
MKSEIAGKRKKEKTFEKKNETPRAVLIPQEHNKRKETKISLLLISLLLLVFDFTTTIQTTIDTDDAQEERETTGITRQKERAD